MHRKMKPYLTTQILSFTPPTSQILRSEQHVKTCGSHSNNLKEFLPKMHRFNTELLKRMQYGCFVLSNLCSRSLVRCTVWSQSAQLGHKHAQRLSAWQHNDCDLDWRGMHDYIQRGCWQGKAVCQCVWKSIWAYPYYRSFPINRSLALKTYGLTSVNLFV